MPADSALQTSDRFLIQGVAGAGGMSTVYRALDRRTGAIVALKVMPEDDPSLAERFSAEARALAALNHPGIVRLVAHGVGPDGKVFLAMEWLDGEDLSMRLDRGALEPNEAVLLGMRVAAALSAAHSKGIVHRDIKPSNLLLPGGHIDRVKLLDFGIARLRMPRRITPSNVALGTPGYMAPEQASGSKDIDPRADVFSLGAVLFECLTGWPAFSGEHVMAVLAKLLLDEVPRVNALCPHVPEALASLVERMLAKDRAARPESAGEVEAALADLAVEIGSAGAEVVARAREPVIEKALTGREQRLVTVVVAHPPSRGSTHPVTGERTCADPRPADEPWTAALRELRSEVEPLGARVDPLLDGSILITWMGAEGPREQATRATRCALLLRRLVPAAPIAVVSGIRDTSEPRPVGQVLDRAAALLTAPGEADSGIRLDAVVARLLDARFQVAESGAGLELLGEDDVGQGARMLLGRPSRCVGRERELRALADLVDECVNEGVARAALVTAPAGMGKSRLRHELLRAIEPRHEGLEVWLARGDFMSAGSAFVLLGSALRSIADVHGGAPLEARRERLFARVARHLPEADRARVAAFLGEMIGVHFPREHSVLLQSALQSSAAMMDQIQRAFRDFIAAECAAHPVLLVLEDLHWGDTPSVALIDATLGDLRARPFMVLALGRPEVREVFPKLWAERNLQEIRLEGLTRRSMEGLVRQALGDTIDEARVAQMAERAEGNAFYLEEMIRAVAEGHGGALPETVLAMVQARLDAFTSEERRALRAASVFGDVFWIGGVEALLGGGVEAAHLGAWLDALVAREVLVRRRKGRFPGERELGFRHALLRDGAYALLTEADRALGHSLAARWLEQAGETDGLLLAEHFERGREPERAAFYRVSAAERALLGDDLKAAIALAEQDLPGDADKELRLLRARILNEAYWFSGDLIRADTQADAILALAPVGSHAWCSGIIIKIMVGADLGSPERVSSAMLAFVDVEAPPDTAPLFVTIHCAIVLVFAMSGPRELAAHHLDRARRVAAGTSLDPTAEWFLSMAQSQWHFVFEGDFSAARVELRRALAWSLEAGDHRWEALTHSLLGWAYVALGALDLAEPHLRRAIERSHPTGHGAVTGRVVLSWVLGLRGAIAEAVAMAERAIEVTRGNVYVEGLARSMLSNALLLGGDSDGAEREARAAVSLLASIPLFGTIALVQLAEVCMAQGRAAEALAAVLEALGPEEPYRTHPTSELRARCVHVEALAATGDHAGARAALARARDRLLASAARIDDEALRRSFLENVSFHRRILALSAERLGPAADRAGD